MKSTKNFFAIFFLTVLLLSMEASAQTAAEIGLMKKVVVKKTKPDWDRFAGMNHSEYELLFSALFLLYKNTLSIQDVPSTCFFIPSCSEYAILSIKKRGLFLGTLGGIERITRCNGLEKTLYKKDMTTGRFIDEP